jgi:phage protein D
MAEGPETGLRIARPTLSLDGQENGALSSGLLSLLIVEHTNGLYRCEALFGNWGNVNNGTGFLYFDRAVLDFGKAFQVKLGTEVIFDGKITGLEANFPEGEAPELNVLAEDRLQDLRMTRRTRTFVDVSDADVIGQIANEHGLSPNVDVSGPTYKVLAQINQSDLAFLRERCRAIDAELWMDGNTLNAQARTQRDGGTLQMTHGNGLRAFSVLADLAGQRTSVTVSGWDVPGKADLRHEASDASMSGEFQGGASGASILSAAFGARKEALVHTVPLSSQEAQAIAEAFFKANARRFVVGRGVAETDSRLRVGGYVDLQGLGPLFNGKYYVAEIRHRFDGVLGLRTEFIAERPALGPAA